MNRFLAGLTALWDWFYARKTAFGSALTLVAGIRVGLDGHSAWWEVALALGSFWAGGGMLKRDAAVKATQAWEKSGGTEQRSEPK